MKKSIIPSLVIVVVFSFLSLCLIGHPVQAGPGPVQTKPHAVPTGQIEKSKTLAALPDLVVDSIWLDNQCYINFKLKNSGLGNIPDGEHKDSVVRIQFGSEIKDFPLPKVDSSGVLKKAGGSVSFNTQVPLKSSQDVKVIVDFNKKIKESDAGKKNNEKVAKLMPQCLPVAQMKADIKTKTSVGTTAGVQKSTGQKGPTIPIGIKADTAPINITILSPTLNSSWDIGSTLKIQWKVMAPTGVFNLLLKTPGMADSQSAASIAVYQKMQPNPAGAFNYDWQIPSYIKPGDYIVEVHYWSDIDQTKVFSKSDIFKINDVTAVVTGIAVPKLPDITVSSPTKDSKWVGGQKMKIEWKANKQIIKNIDRYRIELLDSNKKLIKTIAGEWGGISFLGGPEPYSYQWDIAKDIPSGQYMIKVNCVSSQGFYGEGGLFGIENPFLSATVVGTAGVLKSVSPVKITSFKLIGINPNYNRGILNTLEVVAQIDASRDFIFGPRTNDPKLGPISVEPQVNVALLHVKPGSSIDVGTSKEALSKTFGYYDTNLKITKWFDGGHYHVSFFIPYAGFVGVPYLSPIRVNGFIYTAVGQRTCSIDWQFWGRVTISLEGMSNVLWQEWRDIQFVNPGPPAQEIWVNGYPWDANCTP